MLVQSNAKGMVVNYPPRSMARAHISTEWLEIPDHRRLKGALTDSTTPYTSSDLISWIVGSYNATGQQSPEMRVCGKSNGCLNAQISREPALITCKCFTYMEASMYGTWNCGTSSHDLSWASPLGKSPIRVLVLNKQVVNLASTSWQQDTVIKR